MLLEIRWGSHPWIFVGNAVDPQNPYFLAIEVGLQDSKVLVLLKHNRHPGHCSTVGPRTTKV